MPLILPPQNAVRELVLGRTMYSKLFEMPDNKRRLITRLGRVHYRRDDNELDDISTALEVEAGTGETIADKLPYRFRLRTQGIGFDYRSREDGGIVRLALLRVGNSQINQNQTFAFNRNGNRVRFVDAGTNTDIIFEATRGGIKTYRFLKAANAPKTWRWAIEYNEAGQFKIGTRIHGIDNFNEQVRATRPLQREINVSLVDGAPTLQPSGRMRFIRDETWTGETRAVDQVTHVPFWENTAVYPVAIDPDITENVVADADDGFEQAYQPWQSTNTRDDLGKYFAYLHPAWRFQGVNVPVGATIDLANLIINARSSTFSGGGGKLYGYDTDSAAALSNTVKPTLMAKTTAFTTVSQSTATGLRTYNVTSLVAEIVARAGWASGNNMTIFGIGTTGGYNRTRFEDYADGGTDEAQLEIDYTVAGSGGSDAIIGAFYGYQNPRTRM